MYHLVLLLSRENKVGVAFICMFQSYISERLSRCKSSQGKNSSSNNQKRVSQFSMQIITNCSHYRCSGCAHGSHPTQGAGPLIRVLSADHHRCQPHYRSRCPRHRTLLSPHVSMTSYRNLSKALLAIIANSVVHSSTRTFFTTLFC